MKKLFAAATQGNAGKWPVNSVSFAIAAKIRTSNADARLCTDAFALARTPAHNNSVRSSSNMGSTDSSRGIAAAIAAKQRWMKMVR
jgi:hypothetical protein